jgi:hypothetical protein
MRCFAQGGRVRAAALGANGRGEHSDDLAEFCTSVADHGGDGIAARIGSIGRKRQAGLGGAFVIVLRGLSTAADLIEDLAGAGDGVSLGVDEALDLKNEFDFATAIETLAGAALVGLELGELGFPKAKDVGFEFADAGDVANFEVETVGDCRGMEGAFVGELSGHWEDEEDVAQLAVNLL